MKKRTLLLLGALLILAFSGFILYSRWGSSPKLSAADIRQQIIIRNLDEFPDNPESRIRFDAGRATRDPLAMLEAFLTEEECHPSQYLTVARLYLKRGRPAKAVKVLEAARAAADAGTFVSSKTCAYVEIATVYREAGMTKEALALLALARQMREAEPRNSEKAEISASLALAYNTFGRKSECRTLLDEALAFDRVSELNPYACHDVVLQPLTVAGYGREALQRARDAKCHLCIAAVADVMAGQLIEAGKRQEALDLVVPGSIDELIIGNIVYYRIALREAGEGREEEAVTHMNKLSYSALNCIKKLTILSEIADWNLSTGRRAKAIAVLRRGETILDEFHRPVEACLALAEAFDRVGARQDADRLFTMTLQQFLAKHDTVSIGVDAIIEAFIMHGRDELAFEIAASSETPMYLSDIAIAYAKCGNLAASEKALAKMPDDRTKASAIRDVLFVLAEQKH